MSEALNAILAAIENDSSGRTRYTIEDLVQITGFPRPAVVAALGEGMTTPTDRPYLRRNGELGTGTYSLNSIPQTQ